MGNNPLIMESGFGRDIRASITNNFPAQDVASYRWGRFGSYLTRATIEDLDENPAHLTLSGPAAQLRGEETLEIRATATDFFGNQISGSITSFNVTVDN